MNLFLLEKMLKKCFFGRKKILAFQQIFVSTRLIETHLVEEFFCGDFFYPEVVTSLAAPGGQGNQLDMICR